LRAISGDNVLPMTVNGSNCSANSYINKPCVSVTVCAPGSTTNCMTVDDILVDTGSYGLRIFKKDVLDQNTTLLNALTQVTTGGKNLATCVQFGDGSADWGPVMLADVVLGGEPAVQVPIQVIDSTFASVPAACPDPDIDPATTGFNGILGVGFFEQDCGAGCVNYANNGLYYGCSGSPATCTGIKAGLSIQVQNPVALLPTDNNGVILELPSVPLGGATSASGYMILGIGTQSNNIPSGVTTYTADSSTGEFSTILNGVTHESFIDSGSNALFFPAPSDGSLPDCSTVSSALSGWFCPPSVKILTATNVSIDSVQGDVPFYIGNLLTLANTANSVFVEAGGGFSVGGAALFDWGLPFYIGRNVYLGIENKTSSLGTGPYWAY
jgi:hypothetical protein